MSNILRKVFEDTKKTYQMILEGYFQLRHKSLKNNYFFVQKNIHQKQTRIILKSHKLCFGYKTPQKKKEIKTVYVDLSKLNFVPIKSSWCQIK